MDTYTGSRDFPGEYTLGVTFEPSVTPGDTDPFPDEDTAYDFVPTDDETSFFEDDYLPDEELSDIERPNESGDEPVDEAVNTDTAENTDEEPVMPDEQADTFGETTDTMIEDEESPGCACTVISM